MPLTLTPSRAMVHLNSPESFSKLPGEVSATCLVLVNAGMPRKFQVPFEMILMPRPAGDEQQLNTGRRQHTERMTTIPALTSRTTRVEKPNRSAAGDKTALQTGVHGSKEALSKCGPQRDRFELICPSILFVCLYVAWTGLISKNIRTGGEDRILHPV
ncbi:hypothetical protein T265_11198 [Opisthorchis viverrini]|uniref:Uncharacterized protein n=1 Tax=Opisthorchis viverrini TaxID=6198 RepID=A0A074ZYH5_OPIVI|nr:hypothetical protein T265_11198 [Opisthorchis viverrini]KER20199.1 hypothetical protein T265_11198 [Opisthorchis viverrini]